MKKWILLLLFTSSTHAMAEVINCPTSKNFTFHDKKWTLLVEKDNTTREIDPPYNYGKDFYNYDPIQKIIEGHRTSGISGMIFSYNIFSSRAVKSAQEITLQCNGTYSSNECGNAWWNGGCPRVGGKFEASLSLGHNYKSCMSISNISFDCEK